MSKEILAYDTITVRSNSYGELADRVNKAIRGGWEPLAGPCSGQDVIGHYLMQAMVKYITK